jgi:uncharacterized membrane protein
VSAPHADQIINGYLARLSQAVSDSGLPADRGREIVDDIERHISEARASYASETDADLLNLIDRLGDPAAMVADERQRSGRATSEASATQGRNPAAGFMEVGAILLTVLFWPAGLALVVLSAAWTRREKVTAAALLISIWALAIAVLPLIETLTGIMVTHWWVLLIFLGVFVFPPITAVYLGVRLSQRRRLTPA